MQETGKTEEEIDRTVLWKKARELKTGGYDADVKTIVDKIVSFINSQIYKKITFVPFYFSNICPILFYRMSFRNREALERLHVEHMMCLQRPWVLRNNVGVYEGWVNL